MTLSAGIGVVWGGVANQPEGRGRRWLISDSESAYFPKQDAGLLLH